MIKTEWSKINEYTYHNYDFSYRQCDYYCKAYMFAKHLADARENIVVIKSNYFKCIRMTIIPSSKSFRN